MTEHDGDSKRKGGRKRSPVGLFIGHALAKQQRTQVWLAEAAGVDRTVLSKIMTGEREPTDEQVANIETALGVESGLIDKVRKHQGTLVDSGKHMHFIPQGKPVPSSPAALLRVDDPITAKEFVEKHQWLLTPLEREVVMMFERFGAVSEARLWVLARSVRGVIPTPWDALLSDND